MVPSRAVTSSPPTLAHGSRDGVSCPAARGNSSSSGLSPSLRRAAASAVVAGTASPLAPSPARDLSASWHGRRASGHSASVKQTARCGGSSRARRRGAFSPAAASRASRSAAASRATWPASAGGTNQDRIPHPPGGREAGMTA